MKITQILNRVLPAVLLSAAISLQAQGQLTVSGHVPLALSKLKPLAHVPATNHMRLVIGLPHRNQAELDNLLAELQDPASTNYHRWLSSDQFAERFAPTEEDYQKVISYARGKGFKVTGFTPNRVLLDVEAPAATVETALQVKLGVYQHPTESRTFFSPDREPTVDAGVPILHIAGLDNFVVPHRFRSALKPIPLDTTNIVAYATGSGPGGFFMGSDFRKAYVPGVTNRGGGQYIAIIDVGGPYYPIDVYKYQTNAGLSTNIVVTNIITTFNSYWTNALTTGTVDEGEEVLDIDMAMSMAPDAVIMNYEGEAHDLFNRVAIDNKAKQMTLSYGFGIDSSIQQMFQQFVAQGQSFSQASGDGGADPDGGTGLTGAPYSTVVGGVSLNTSGANGPWLSNPTWGGSGGGISGYGIPTWQQGINMTNNQGSLSFRNYPDVSMPADNIFTVYKNGTVVGGTGGTSAASPLWAGFMALVNQQAASLGQPPVGFINPAIYAIGKSPYSVYTNCFHDVTTGNTYNSHSPTRFSAVTGYDLCTGWGTPTGSNTINALVGVGTNDFMFYPSQGVISLVAGASANGTITMTRLNGLTGSATFTVSGLPTGMSFIINPASTPNTTTFAISTVTNLVPKNYPITLTGTLGLLSHSETLTVVVNPQIPGATQVNLASYYNRSGMFTDGRSFSVGVDGSYSAYSATLLGRSLSWNGLVFNLGPSNSADVVYCAGQTISLPAGRFNTLQMLATGVQGNQTAQTFTVTYTDNSTATFTQSFSDWADAQSYPGEFTVITMPYRNLNGGNSQSLNVSVDGYFFTLDQTKTVKSIKLPSDSNVVILSVMLANNQVNVPLATYFNRAGMYADGVTFTNPATGGVDGSYAYSATSLGGSVVWTNTLFVFGPPNVTNVVSATNQTIALPAGNYSVLRMLGSGVQGSYAAQPITIHYADGTSSAFSQGFSDWFQPQNYSGEVKAIPTGHRNAADGTADNRTFYLYGYSFKLNSGKVVQSLTLPNKANVIIAAMSLIPNWPPTFNLNPFAQPDITAGQSYYNYIYTNATDLNSDAMTYGLVSGPSWLSVSPSGFLSGVPVSTNVGLNTFIVSVSDSGGMSNTATMNINVNPAPSIQPVGVVDPANGFTLSWSGGIAPYQLLMSTNLADPNGWTIVGEGITSNSISLLPTNPAAFYRITGQ